jgi:hypothetical protein
MSAAVALATETFLSAAQRALPGARIHMYVNRSEVISAAKKPVVPVAETAVLSVIIRVVNDRAYLCQLRSTLLGELQLTTFRKNESCNCTVTIMNDSGPSLITTEQGFSLVPSGLTGRL